MRLTHGIEMRAYDLLSGAHNRLAASLDFRVNLHSDQAAQTGCRNLNEETPFFNANFVSDVKRAQQVFIREGRIFDGLFKLSIRMKRFRIKPGVKPDAERTQKNARQKLPLADAHVQQILLVVLKFDPRAAIRNHFGNEERTALEEDAGRAMKLRDDDALRAVDDESSIVCHQRNLAEEDL